MQFFISVIIPVYNGERFIEKAIKSALQQPEVFEIVVVNDGSTDGTQVILERLQTQYSILKLYSHPNQSNKGRSATRNLGIQKATGNYIAFLDADDYFLSNRFTNDVKLFQENTNCDGVYNAIGVHFYRETTTLEQERLQLYTVTQKIDPEDLFESLLSGKNGHFSIDGLTVKKSVFDSIGYFNENLIVAEDTDLLWKMALKCKLVAGIVDKPLAMWGLHDSNVFNRSDLYDIYILKMYESLIIWSCNNNVSPKKTDDLLKWLWLTKYKENNKLYQDISYWASLFLPRPRLMFSVFSIKYFPLIRYRQMLFPFLYGK